MKNILILSMLLFIITKYSYAQSVGIGTATPSQGALLDVTSTTKGFLPPQLTNAQRNTTTNTANGLLITCSDSPTAGLHHYIDGVRERLPHLALEQCLSLLSTGMSRKGMGFR